MYTLLPADESANLDVQLQTAMKRHSSLWISLFTAYGGPFAFAVGFLFIFCVHCFNLRASGGSESDTGSPGISSAAIIATVTLVHN